MKVIGLAGVKGSGKSEAARALQSLGYARAPFARPLKDMLRALGLSENQVDGPLKESPIESLGGLTPRLMMQTLGSEWGRRFHPDFWVRIWLQRYAGDPEAGLVVADDVRFPNEAAAIKTLGGAVLLIDRPGLRVDKSAHSSERPDLLDVDFVIKNDGTVAELREKLLSKIISDA